MSDLRLRRVFLTSGRDFCRLGVAAIAKREREEITERKNSLAALMSNIAEIGGANVQRKIGKASVRDAIIGTGIAVDKMLALVGQTPVSVGVVFMPSEAEREECRRLDARPDAIAKRLTSPAVSGSQRALTQGE